MLGCRTTCDKVGRLENRLPSTSRGRILSRATRAIVLASRFVGRPARPGKVVVVFHAGNGTIAVVSSAVIPLRRRCPKRRTALLA